MTFAEAIAIIEGETSSHITKMIKELTQLEGQRFQGSTLRQFYEPSSYGWGILSVGRLTKGFAGGFIISNSST